MKPTTKPMHSAEQKAEEEAIRRRHAASPIRTPPAGTIGQASFAAILRVIAKFKTARESQGLTVDEVAARMGIDATTLTGMEAGTMLNPPLATLCKWAEAMDQRLEIDVNAR